MLREQRAIAAARVLAGLSQRELADAAQLALSVVQAIEQGTSDPRNSSILALVDALADHGVRIFGESQGAVLSIVLERDRVPASQTDERKVRKQRAPAA